MCMKEVSNEWMKYTVGEDVKCAKTGKIGVITRMDSINNTYIVVIDGMECIVPEEELSKFV